MTDKERLEEIEKNLDPLGYGMGGHLISVNDIYWLVRYAKEQSKRVQELEQQNKRYKQALEFYADEETYEMKFVANTDEIGVPLTVIELDEGKKARQALEDEE